jgi:glycosyltransferase involved in cell wall biosynthesis
MERTGIDHQVQFAGDRDDQLFEKTSAPVEPLGYLSRPDLAEAFCRADCLVLPSRHDSFGRVVVEAMGTGLPVLLSDHVGAKEVIEQGETGWVVPVEDAEALAEQMQWCIEHSEQVQSMREVAVETAQKYSWTAYHKRAREAIASVVENH